MWMEGAKQITVGYVIPSPITLISCHRPTRSPGACTWDCLQTPSCANYLESLWASLRVLGPTVKLQLGIFHLTHLACPKARQMVSEKRPLFHWKSELCWRRCQSSSWPVRCLLYASAQQGQVEVAISVRLNQRQHFWVEQYSVYK